MHTHTHKKKAACCTIHPTLVGFGEGLQIWFCKNHHKNLVTNLSFPVFLLYPQHMFLQIFLYFLLYRFSLCFSCFMREGNWAYERSRWCLGNGGVFRLVILIVFLSNLCPRLQYGIKPIGNINLAGSKSRFILTCPWMLFSPSQFMWRHWLGTKFKKKGKTFEICGLKYSLCGYKSLH